MLSACYHRCVAPLKITSTWNRCYGRIEVSHIRQIYILSWINVCPRRGWENQLTMPFEYISGWINIWMSKLVNGLVDELICELTNEIMDECMHAWMNERTIEWASERTYERPNECVTPMGLETFLAWAELPRTIPEGTDHTSDVQRLVRIVLQKAAPPND